MHTRFSSLAGFGHNCGAYATGLLHKIPDNATIWAEGPDLARSGLPRRPLTGLASLNVEASPRGSTPSWSVSSRASRSTAQHNAESAAAISKRPGRQRHGVWMRVCVCRERRAIAAGAASLSSAAALHMRLRGFTTIVSTLTGCTQHRLQTAKCMQLRLPTADAPSNCYMLQIGAALDELDVSFVLTNWRAGKPKGKGLPHSNQVSAARADAASGAPRHARAQRGMTTLARRARQGRRAAAGWAELRPLPLGLLVTYNPGPSPMPRV